MTQTVPAKASTWRRVLAFILDLACTFFGFGFLVATIFGGRTEDGFSLTGGPALLLFALIIGYFVILNRFCGGTVWKWILRANRGR